MGETYYDVLDVASDATQDEIEAAYRERVFETHPDHSDDPDATERFQRVSTARSVLTDDAERARYDRLGHEAYVQGHSSHERATRASSANETASEEQTTRGRGSQRTARGRGGATRQRSTDGWSFEEVRQQAERERARAQAGEKRRTDAGSRFRSGSGAQSGSRTRTRTRTTTQSTAATGSPGSDAAESDETASDAGFQYTVHDWEGEVDLEWDGRSLDQPTIVTIVCIWALYPLFVYSSLTPAFPPVVNGIVAACTLGLVGYLLTMPRIATVVFGSWSLALPVAVLTVDAIPLAVLSIRGFLALAFVWVPFGYAVVLWWALRP